MASRSDSATNGSVEAGVGEILDRRRAHLGELERRLEEARGEALDAARRQLSSVARNGPSLAP